MAKVAKITGLTADMFVAAALKQLLQVRVDDLWAWRSLVHDPANADELHDMRIAAKRLRYCLEFFAPLLGEAAAPVLAKFKQLQDYLGDIHDCDVWAPMLRKLQRKELKHEGGAGALTAEADVLIGDLSIRRNELFAKFITYWDELDAQGFNAELLAIADLIDEGECNHGS